MLPPLRGDAGVAVLEYHMTCTIKRDDVETSYFKKTLLVEDEGVTRNAMKALLMQCDPRLEIEVAGSFDSCTERLVADRYDLLFLDFQLGEGGSGLDVLKWIRTAEIPIHTVMLSAQDDKETILACIQEGASGFVSKKSEADGNIFRTALDTILNGQIYLPSKTFGRGGHSPQSIAPPVRTTVESLQLSPRLMQTLGFICQGLPNKAIARSMNVTEGTIKEYTSALLKEFGVARRTELIVEMARRGLVIPRP